MALLLVPVAVMTRQRPRMPAAPPAPDPLQRDTAAVRSSRPRAAAGTVDGLVTDTSLVPLADAEVTILRTALKVRTGPNGRFRITQMPSGEYLIIVRHLGFHPTSTVVAVPGNDTLRESFLLQRLPPGLDTVRVVTERRSFRMMEFEDRRKLGEGQFLTETQIDQHGGPFVADLLRFFFRGVNIEEERGVGGSGGQSVQYAISRRGDTGSWCVMQVIVDDVAMPTPFDLDLLPSPKEIAGIELYTGPAVIPARYNSLGAWCGLVLVWTKTGA